MEIVINTCYGGFGLSYKAIMLYAELKGITLYSEQDIWKIWRYYYIPVKKMHKLQKKYEKKYSDDDLRMKISYNKFLDINLDRFDPVLLHVVETLGEEANGPFAKLQIVQAPDNFAWDIQDYDGKETILLTQPLERYMPNL